MTHLLVAALSEAVAAVASVAVVAAAPPAVGSADATPKPPQIIRVEVPGSTVGIELLPVPGPDGTPQFLIGRTEIPWDLYDVFVFGLDQEDGASTPEADAVTRPSKPYISMDRGFGTIGYPAISMSHRSAVQFCEWLSVKTGRRFRLPTEAEWRRLCEASGITSETLLEHAWVAENADGTTHPIGRRRADALGLVDLFGNAAEWVTTADGRGATMGGSYLDAARALACGRSVPHSDEWNRSDPQFPKSVWWLADGGFVGIRVLCEIPAAAASTEPNPRAAAGVP
jgi:hypothetical protein